VTQYRTGPLFRTKDEAFAAILKINDGYKYKVIQSMRRRGWWTIVGEM
jgi:hypothetical protein